MARVELDLGSVWQSELDLDNGVGATRVARKRARRNVPSHRPPMVVPLPRRRHVPWSMPPRQRPSRVCRRNVSGDVRPPTNRRTSRGREGTSYSSIFRNGRADALVLHRVRPCPWLLPGARAGPSPGSRDVVTHARPCPALRPIRSYRSASASTCPRRHRSGSAPVPERPTDRRRRRLGVTCAQQIPGSRKRRGDSIIEPHTPPAIIERHHRSRGHRAPATDESHIRKLRSKTSPTKDLPARKPNSPAESPPGRYSGKLGNGHSVPCSNKQCGHTIDPGGFEQRRLQLVGDVPHRCGEFPEHSENLTAVRTIGRREHDQTRRQAQTPGIDARATRRTSPCHPTRKQRDRYDGHDGGDFDEPFSHRRQSLRP